jgi:hypothetical protein
MSDARPIFKDRDIRGERAMTDHSARFAHCFHRLLQFTAANCSENAF